MTISLSPELSPCDVFGDDCGDKREGWLEKFGVRACKCPPKRVLCPRRDDCGDKNLLNRSCFAILAGFVPGCPPGDKKNRSRTALKQNCLFCPPRGIVYCHLGTIVGTHRSLCIVFLSLLFASLSFYNTSLVDEFARRKHNNQQKSDIR